MWRTVFRLEWTLMARDRAMLTVLVLYVCGCRGGPCRWPEYPGFYRWLRAFVRESDNRLTAVMGELRDLIANEARPGTRPERSTGWDDGAAPPVKLPSRPLVSVAVGQRTLLPQAMVVDTSAHLSEARETETPMNAPTRLLTGAFDLAFLFVVLFPLVVIGLSYELLSGERARGTLPCLCHSPYRSCRSCWVKRLRER